MNHSYHPAHKAVYRNQATSDDFSEAYDFQPEVPAHCPAYYELVSHKLWVSKELLRNNCLTYVNNWYKSNISADARKSVNGDEMSLLTKDEAKDIPKDVLKCPKANGASLDFWWLKSYGSGGNYVAYVLGTKGTISENGLTVGSVIGVRPALKLDLSKVVFDSTSKTFSLRVTGVTLDNKSVPLTVGEAKTLTATLSPDNAANKTVLWSKEKAQFHFTCGLVEGQGMQGRIGDGRSAAGGSGDGFE